MSEEKYDAKLDQVKGSLKEFSGKLTGDKETETEGKVEKTVAKAKAVVTDVKDTIEGAIKGIKNAKDDSEEPKVD